MPQHQLVTVILILLTSHCTRADRVNGQSVANLLQILANDGLGVSAMQDYLDQHVGFNQQTIQGADVLEELSNSLNEKFQDSIDAVKAIQATVMSELSKFTTDMNGMPLCCDTPNLEQNEDFQQPIHVNLMCNTGIGTKDPDSVYPNDRLLGTFQINRNNNMGLKWQYYGSESGVLTSYPAAEKCYDDFYDPRYRPWYVEAATPKPKDVVIIVDKSGSMMNKHEGRTLMEIAKEAAATVIETLNPNDRVALVAFSGEAITPQGSRDTSTCYHTELAQATPINQPAFTEFLKSVNHQGATEYTKAFQTAFDIFKESSTDDPDRDMVILFMTDGQPTDSMDDTREVIRTENAALGNRVVILTFGLGQGGNRTDIGAGARQVLEELAEQSFADKSAGDVTPGEFVYVDDPNDLRASMASYYDFFSKNSVEIDDPIFTVPYVDYSGLGLVLSSCLPVYNNLQLEGVACIDIVVSDLLSEVTYFSEGSLSYAFVVDSTGRTLIHPLLPTPEEITDDPVFVHLTSLEREADAKDILDQIEEGKSGHSQYYTTFVRPRGDTVHEGVYTVRASADYYWTEIGTTGLWVCVVVANGEKYYELEEQTNLPEDVYYYRLDISDKPDVCNYHGSISIKDASTVKFAPQAFEDPFLYIGFAENLYDVRSYENYLTGYSARYRLKEGIRDTVTVTHEVDTIWSEREATYSIWRSIGMEDGVYRVLPGTLTDKLYDHTKRPWYKRAIGQKGLTVMSTPYEDAFGSGYVLTLSESLFVGRPSRQHTEDDTAIGVMSMDLSLMYFYYQLIQYFPDCELDETYKCMVIDNSGYLVVHTDFVNIKDGKIPKVSGVHLIEKEPAIAQDLINSRYMQNKACVNFESLRDQYFWELVLPSNVDGKIITSFYELHLVPESNLYMAIKLKDRASAPCECGDVMTFKCPSNQCRCPCYTTAPYDYCEDRFTLGIDGWPTCLPETATFDINHIKNSGVHLEDCLNYNCDGLEIDSCVSISSCSWCHTNKAGKELSEPYCAEKSVCILGLVDSKDGGKTTDDGGGGSSSGGAIAGAIIGVLIVIVILAVAFWFLRKKYLVRKEKKDRQKAAASAVLAEARHSGNSSFDSSSRTGSTTLTDPSRSISMIADPYDFTPGRPPPSYNKVSEYDKNYIKAGQPLPHRPTSMAESPPNFKPPDPLDKIVAAPPPDPASPPDFNAPSSPTSSSSSRPYQNHYKPASLASTHSGDRSTDTRWSVSPENVYMKARGESLYEDIDTYSVAHSVEPDYMEGNQPPPSPSNIV